MFKEHAIFILVPIASASISSLVVDQHPIATTNDEQFENADPIALDVDLVAPNVVMDIPLRKLERVHSPQFQMTTLSTCMSMGMMWVMCQIRLPTIKPLLVLNLTSGSMQ